MKGIEQTASGSIHFGPEGIPLLRLVTMLRGLGLELKGIRMCRGISCYALAKKEFGLKGNKAKVYAQLAEIVRQKLEEAGADDNDREALVVGSGAGL